MDEQFDNDLKNHINKVLENFEDPSVGEGWRRFEEKFPETGTNRSANWLWAGAAAVAVLLIFFGINTLTKRLVGETKRLSQKTQNRQGLDTLSPSSATVVTRHAVGDTVLPKTNSKLSLKGNNRLAVKAPAINTGSAKPQTYKTGKEAIATAQTINTGDNLTSVKNADTSKTIAKEVAAASSVVANEDTVVKTQSLIALQNPFKKPDTTLFTEKHGIAKFTEKHGIAKPRQNVKKDNGKIEFGVYAATYINYAQGSSNSFNAGAGVTADIRLFKKLKLSTGLAIAQNTLNYGAQLPNLSSVVNDGATLAFDFQQTLAANNGAAYALVLKNYTARLVGLDVPVNLKYEFNAQKNDRYFSIGLSSGVFIHESYTYQYNYLSQVVQAVVTSTGLNSFYLAKTLNVAVGLGYPVGKTNRLIIEPFLKYPLSGLGGEGIRFGASGINVKFDFQSSKK